MHGVPGRGLSIGFYCMLHMILGIACVGVGSFYGYTSALGI